MNVTPSTKTTLLDVAFDSDGNMLDASGNYVEDTDSITSSVYYQSLDSSGNSSENSSEDSSEDSSENSSEE